MLEYDTMIAT